jgi:hypothetical protein
MGISSHTMAVADEGLAARLYFPLAYEKHVAESSEAT